MITFKDFRKKTNDYFLKNYFDFLSKKYTFANIYYVVKTHKLFHGIQFLIILIQKIISFIY